MGFTLQEKGELFMLLESVYGVTPAASTLLPADSINLAKFTTERVPGKVTTEDEGGMIPGVQGQPLLKVNEMQQYTGMKFLREFTVPVADTGERPTIDRILRSGGW